MFLLSAYLGWTQASSNNAGQVHFVPRAVRATIYPMQWVVSGVSTWVADVATGIWNGKSLNAKVRDLESKVATASQNLDRINQLEKEVMRLKILMGMTPIPNRKNVPAIIIGNFPTEKKIQLNVGAAKGIKAGDAVIAPLGLVGQVVEVGPSSCYVNLITHPDFSVGAKTKFGNAAVVGIARGVSEDTMTLEVYSSLVEVKVKDLVVTSGLSETYPEGIRIGWLSDIRLDPNYGIRRGVIKPAAGLDNLREVVVLAK